MTSRLTLNIDKILYNRKSVKNGKIDKNGKVEDLKELRSTEGYSFNSISPYLPYLTLSLYTKKLSKLIKAKKREQRISNERQALVLLPVSYNYYIVNFDSLRTNKLRTFQKYSTVIAQNEKKMEQKRQKAVLFYLRLVKNRLKNALNGILEIALFEICTRVQNLTWDKVSYG